MYEHSSVSVPKVSLDSTPNIPIEPLGASALVNINVQRMGLAMEATNVHASHD